MVLISLNKGQCSRKRLVVSTSPQRHIGDSVKEHLCRSLFKELPERRRRVCSIWLNLVPEYKYNGGFESVLLIVVLNDVNVDEFLIAMDREFHSRIVEGRKKFW